jgi:class 3 adenylate cyclase/tetratricopeptide (TPR) repeat protein
LVEERKVVTALFADIVGSTDLTTSAEPEVIRALLARTFERAKGILEQHGGTVEKFMGDEVMAVFGAPIAHDDDAERAVRAAFAVRESLEVPLSVRVGVNTGEVLASSTRGDQSLVTGLPVIAAARLRQGAEPGEILVGELTHNLTRSGVRYGRPRTIQAKGLGPLRAYRAEALASTVPESRRGIRGLRAPLIGRDAEIRLLRETLRRVASEGTPYAVTVYGLAGTGKSRLINEFIQRQREGFVLRGRCLPYGDAITWWPFQEVIRQDASITLSDSADASRERVLARTSSLFMGSANEASAVADGLITMLDPRTGGRHDAAALAWSFRRYLERRSTDTPVVLVIEDIHWAEPALLGALEDLIGSFRGPLLLICVTRPELLEIRSSWMAGRKNAASIDLAPLRSADTTKLVNALLEVSAVSHDVRDAIVDRAEGNPLYVEEILRMLIDEGALQRHGERWTGELQSADLRVPPSLHGIIAARIDRLPSGTKTTLQAAAVIGRVFWTDVLSTLSGTSDLNAEIKDAVSRDLIEAVEERGMRGGSGFKFKHVLVRDVAYGGTHKAARLDVHDRLTAWLSDAAGDRAAEFTEVIAHHAEQACALARELDDPRAPRMAIRAISCLRGAVDAAYAREDPTSVLSLCDRALAIARNVGQHGLEIAEIQAIGALTRFARDEDDVSVADLEAAVISLRAFPPGALLVRCLADLSYRHLSSGDIKRGTDLSEEMVASARATGLPAVVADALTESRNAAWAVSDDVEEVRRLTEAAAYVREHALRLPHVNPFEKLSRFAADRGLFDEALALRKEADAILRLRPWLDGVDPAFAGARSTAFWRGDWELALSSSKHAMRYAQALGNRPLIANAFSRIGEAYYALGDAAESERCFRETLTRYEAMANRSYIPEARWRQARALLALGRMDEARTQAERAYAEALPEDRHGKGASAGQLALVREADGKTEEAEVLFREALDHLSVGYQGLSLSDVRRNYAEFLMRRRRFTEARQVLELVRDFYEGDVVSRRRAPIEKLLQRCAELATEAPGP